MNTELENTFATRIAELHATHQAQHAWIERRLVSYANTKREIGILLREWSNHENINVAFYEARKDSIPFSFDAAKDFIAVANTVPKPATTITDARNVIRAAFVAVGKRVARHKATTKPPIIEFVRHLHAGKLRLQSWTDDDPVEQWSDERKASVAAELAWAVHLHKAVVTGTDKIPS